jgi:succinoglycan biosynthesis protein ExoA
VSDGLVTVAIPVLDEAAAIGECLERLRNQSHADMEILVADGGSTDDTRAIVDAHAAEDPRVVLIDNPGRLQSAGLNRVLASARGSIVVRLDARSFVDERYVEHVVDLLGATGAAVVGGRMVPRPRPGDVAAAIALANESAWGAGPARFHTGGSAGPAETVYLGAFDRRRLDEVGGWSTDVGVNEDYELNHRIRQAGGVVWFDPALEVGYEPRADLRALARQYFRYGRSKATVMRRHPRSVRARQVLPVGLAPAGVLALAARGRPGTVARCVLLLHAAAVAALAARAPAPASVRALGAGAAATMHWAWSIGFWFGLVRPFPEAPG